jgi:catechol 2,3-dioxygenase-like lactoylglutathione lyase family enzyme
MKGAPVSLPLQNLQAITLFVDDLPRTAAFYRDVFGLGILHRDDDSTAFFFGNTVINLLHTPAAHELIEPARVAGAATGSRMQLTVQVDDVDSTCRALAEHGVRLLNGPMDRPWGIRTAAFADPAGHVWEIAAPLGEGGD